MAQVFDAEREQEVVIQWPNAKQTAQDRGYHERLAGYLELSCTVGYGARHGSVRMTPNMRWSRCRLLEFQTPILRHSLAPAKLQHSPPFLRGSCYPSTSMISSGFKSIAC